MISPIRKFFRRSFAKKLSRDRFSIASLIKQTQRIVAKIFLPFLKQSRRKPLKLSGFTLIELLVSMLIATLIISTLLAFTINIMETDRREQSKVESQGEVQAALDYIADDLQESVYIYNADGLTRLTTATAADATAVPPVVAAPAQLPVFTNSTPVLVFWKRIYYAPSDEPRGSMKLTGCVEYDSDTSCDSDTSIAGIQPKGSGRYVYALVAYYLINNPDSTWSNAARIGRWEIRDGIRSTCQNPVITSCPALLPITAVQMTSSASINYWTPPDAGFKLFDSSGSTKDIIMNSWTKAVADYSSTLTPLIDFIDDSPYSTDQDDGSLVTPTGNPQIKIAIQQNVVVSGNTTNARCADPIVGVGGASASAAQRIPSQFKTTSTNTSENLSSFYVCVNSTETVARVYLRGNAMARLRPNQIESQRRISAQTDTYLTTGNVRAFGRGKLFFGS